jgi:hypothetical protein
VNEDPNESPEADSQRDDEKCHLKDQQAPWLVDKGRTDMFIVETRGNDKTRRSTAYGETMGGRDTHHTQFLGPGGKGQAHALVNDSRGSPGINEQVDNVGHCPENAARQE